MIGFFKSYAREAPSGQFCPNCGYPIYFIHRFYIHYCNNCKANIPVFNPTDEHGNLREFNHGELVVYSQEHNEFILFNSVFLDEIDIAWINPSYYRYRIVSITSYSVRIAEESGEYIEIGYKYDSNVCKTCVHEKNIYKYPCISCLTKNRSKWEHAHIPSDEQITNELKMNNLRSINGSDIIL